MVRELEAVRFHGVRWAVVEVAYLRVVEVRNSKFRTHSWCQWGCTWMCCNKQVMDGSIDCSLGLLASDLR